MVTGASQYGEGLAYYKIKAIDINDNESSFSSELEVRIMIDPYLKIGTAQDGNSIEN
ncbi:MAG: hypothetical protein P8X73_06785 [Ignavibacteriaceae bacterium]